jgi:hypothetical protein
LRSEAQFPSSFQATSLQTLAERKGTLLSDFLKRRRHFYTSTVIWLRFLIAIQVSILNYLFFKKIIVMQPFFKQTPKTKPTRPGELSFMF